MKNFRKTSFPKSLFTLLLALAGQCCFGQNPLDYVPADVPMVLTVNLGNLNKKVTLEQLKMYDFYKAMVREMEQSEMTAGEQDYLRKFMETPEELGFDVLQPFYFFVNKVEDTTFYTMVMKMGNRARYEGGLMELFPDDYINSLTEKDGYNIWQHNDETYAWNNDVILNIWNDYTPSYNEDWAYDEAENTDYGTVETPDYEWNESPDSAYNEVWVEEIKEVPMVEDLEVVDQAVDEEDIVIEEPYIDAVYDTMIPPLPGIEPPIEMGTWEEGMGDFLDFAGPDLAPATANWVHQVMTRQFGATVSTNPKFMTARAQKSDVHFWMNYSYFMEEYQKLQSISPGMYGGEMAQYMAMMQGMTGVVYDEAYFSMGLSFEEGKMALRSQTFFGEDLLKFYRKANDAKFNKKFLRYVEGGENMFGYVYFNMSVKNAIDEGKSLMHKMLQSSPDKGQAASDALHILGIFIDEEAIGNLLKGDFMLSVSGMQTVNVETTTYEFDADYNMTTKDTIVEKTLPMVTALASYGNQKDIMKFINLGLHSGVLTNEGAFYKMKIPDAGFDFFIALQKGLLVMTNDRNLIEKNLAKGFSKKQRLAKHHRKLLCENASVMYWDIPNTMKASAGDTSESNIGPMAYVNMFGKKFDNVTFTSPKKVEGSVNSEFGFYFKNRGANSLDQFFNFINDIYMEVIGGAKI